MVQSILEECPKPDCLIVFPGRSNILLSGYMNAKNLGKHVNLPVSGIRGSDAEFIKKAKPRFTQEVLQPFLKSELNGIKKIVVVDYVNGGGSITNASKWIQEFTHTINPSTKVSVLSYGKTIAPEFEKELSKAGISTHYLGSSSYSGSPGQLAAGSLLENYAPYDQWNPISDKNSPVFKKEVRRHYPYPSEPYNQYASYDDIVEWFKEEKFTPRLPKIDCLNKFLGNAFTN